MTPPTFPPSIYVGETSKSLYERSKQHWSDYRAGQEDSHILKHQTLHHGGDGSPKFHFRPVQFFQKALGRQVAEAIRIERLGEEVVLNSKSEFNRSKISRLTLGEESEKDKEMRVEKGKEKEAETNKEPNTKIRDWETERAKSRRIQELQTSINLERGVVRSPPRKRMGEEETGRRPRKLKYPLLAETWGEEEQKCPPTIPPSTHSSTVSPSHTPTTLSPP